MKYLNHNTKYFYSLSFLFAVQHSIGPMRLFGLTICFSFGAHICFLILLGCYFTSSFNFSTKRHLLWKKYKTTHTPVYMTRYCDILLTTVHLFWENIIIFISNYKNHYIISNLFLIFKDLIYTENNEKVTFSIYVARFKFFFSKLSDLIS